MLLAEVGEFHSFATPTLAEFDGARGHNHHAFVAHRNIFYKEINNTKISLIITREKTKCSYCFI